jgi:hypothetical protein
VATEPVTTFHVLRRPGKEQLAKTQTGDEHVSPVDLARFDLVPLDRIACVIDFHPFAGLKFSGRDRRLAVLRELAVELLLIYFYREEALSTGISYL